MMTPRSAIIFSRLRRLSEYARYQRTIAHDINGIMQASEGVSDQSHG